MVTMQRRITQLCMPFPGIERQVTRVTQHGALTGEIAQAGGHQTLQVLANGIAILKDPVRRYANRVFRENRCRELCVLASARLLVFRSAGNPWLKGSAAPPPVPLPEAVRRPTT